MRHNLCIRARSVLSLSYSDASLEGDFWKLYFYSCSTLSEGARPKGMEENCGAKGESKRGKHESGGGKIKKSRSKLKILSSKGYLGYKTFFFFL